MNTSIRQILILLNFFLETYAWSLCSISISCGRCRTVRLHFDLWIKNCSKASNREIWPANKCLIHIFQDSKQQRVSVRGVNEAYSNFHHPSCFYNYLHLMISTIDTLENPNLKPLILTTIKSPINTHGVLKDTNSNLSFVTTEKVKSTTFSDFFSASQQLKMESVTVTFLIERCLVFGVHGVIFLVALEVEPMEDFWCKITSTLWCFGGWAILDGQKHPLGKGCSVAMTWLGWPFQSKSSYLVILIPFPSSVWFPFDSSIMVYPVTKESRIYNRSTANCVACSVAKSCISLGWQTHGAQCASKVMGMKNHAKGIWRYGLRN